MLFLFNNIRFSVIIANSQEILKSFAIPIALVYLTNLAFNAYAVKYQNIKSIEKEEFLNKLKNSIKDMNNIEHIKGMNKIE